MHFAAVAVAGAPNDPITRYAWDFNGDGVPEFTGPTVTAVDYAVPRCGALHHHA